MLFESQYCNYGKVTVSTGKILDCTNEVQDVIFVDYSVEEEDDNELCRASIRFAFSDTGAVVKDHLLDEVTQSKLDAYALHICDDFISLLFTMVQYETECAELVK